MALLHGLIALSEADRLSLRLHVGHLNHKIRGAEADADADFVTAAVRDLGPECTVEVQDIPALAQAQSRSIEEVARQQRYRFLERLCLRTGSQIVATGHQADDQAETILHRILRGTGLRGLGGMRTCRPIRVGSEIRLIRPLLCSRIRTKILPMLAAELNPQVTEAVLRLGEQARCLEDHLAETALRMFETLVVSRTDRELTLNAEALLRKRRIIQTELIRQAVLTFHIGEQDVTFGNLSAVAGLAAETSSGKHVQLPKGLKVTKRYGRLIFSLCETQPPKPPVPAAAIRVPGQTSIPLLRMQIDAVVRDFQHGMLTEWKQQKTAYREWLDYDQVRQPLTVRSAQAGDRFRPLGAPGSKTLADFFTDAKIEPSQRADALVMCDRVGLVWVIPFRIDERVKVTSSTRRVLDLTAYAGERTDGR